MIPKNDLDYVKLYTEKLKDDNSLYKQQKMLIESQFHSSHSFFRKKFGTGEEFKINARKFLKNIGLIK